MAEFLIVSDAVAPVADGEGALSVVGLAGALVADKHKVAILSLGAPAHVSKLPGIARRLRTVAAVVNGANAELPLFEGRSVAGQAHIYVLGLESPNRGATSLALGCAVESLSKDGLIKPDVVVGWGETAASALRIATATARVLIIPDGKAGPALSAADRASLGAEPTLAASGVDSLLAIAAVNADVLVVPSAAAARDLVRHPALAARPSDQPISAVRFGCDDPPHDPASDAALPARYSSANLAGKAECRRHLAKRTGLALGARTLVLAVPPIPQGPDGEALCEAIARVARLDLAIVVEVEVEGSAPSAHADRLRVLAIENPGKVAISSETTVAAHRATLAGADLALVLQIDNLTGRPAGIAARYGTLPIALQAGANADQLVEFDEASFTGSALLFSTMSAFELEGAVRRAIALRSNADAWQGLVKQLLDGAPIWRTTTAQITGLLAAVAPDQVPLAG